MFTFVIADNSVLLQWDQFLLANAYEVLVKRKDTPPVSGWEGTL